MPCTARFSLSRVAIGMLILLAAAATAPAQTLRWAARGDAQTMDPHAALETVTFNLNSLVYDTLVAFDRQGRIVPALATRWQPVGPTVWRIDLRRDVRFQDGTPFTAADAVFSIERAQQPNSKFAQYALRLGKPSRIDDHTVELRQAQPTPIMPELLSAVMIMSRDWAAAHQALQVPDLKNGDEAWSNRHAMGTGRYLLRQYEPGVRTLLARNPAWWGRAEGNVEQIVYLPIASDASRTAALLAGDVDFLQDVPVADVERLRRHAAVRVLEGSESRLIYFGFDQYRDELPHASVKGRNPFKDRRVREAFSLAIDVEALKARIMRGFATPTSCIASSAAGCLAAEMLAPAAADLARARRLLAEAGYPQGFRVTLDCPNDRYVNDRALCVAAAGMLARIGVQVDVEAQTKTRYFPKLQRFDTSFFLGGFGIPAADQQQFLDPVLHSPDAKNGKGTVNFGRFADAELDRLIDTAGAEMNPARRAPLIRQAQQRAREQHYLVPVHRQALIWAARSNVDVVVTADNMVRVDWVAIR